MKNCCIADTTDKTCQRISDGKIFDLPRKYSRQRCKNMKGFTMRSSCAPYKDCFTTNNKKATTNARKSKHKKSNRQKTSTAKKKSKIKQNHKNILGKTIAPCSTQPLTGYHRDGYCLTEPDDAGKHTVCAIMDEPFLKFTKSKNNDLSSVVKVGEKWCLCQDRWMQAYNDHKAPVVDMHATSMQTDKDIIHTIKQHSKQNQRKTTPSTTKAYFAGGCFWGLEDKFSSVKHVLHTRVGFMGGTKHATYEEVCQKKTNHAETVEIVYDKQQVSFAKLVTSFFSFHDPTTLNQQGPDVGRQYRSIAFYSNPTEKKIIEEYIKTSSKQIVTEVKQASTFYPADETHQHYYQKRKQAL